MKIQQILLAAATVMLLTTSSVWADGGGKNRSDSDAPRREQGREHREHKGGYARAPELMPHPEPVRSLC